jgi:hypothetical protein
VRESPDQADVMMITVHGWCGHSLTELTTLVSTGQAHRILDANGDFVVVVRESRRDMVITSRSGVVNYFYAKGPGRLVHGTEVAAVAEAARLPWRWDHSAVGDYLRLGHPLGQATVHAGVRRFLPGTVTRLARSAEGGETSTLAVSELAPEEDGRATIRAAAAELLEAVAAAGPDCAVSMSGGLDSRVMLAALLHLGHRPALLISGVPGSFDRLVGSAIAARFGLRVTVVAVTAAAVRDGANEVARVTGGLLPATNWAGLEHLRSVRDTLAGPVMHGTNGEFARSYYAPAAGLATLRIARKPRAWFPELLSRSTGPPFRESEADLLCAELREALRPEACRARLAVATAGLPGATALAVADEFFLRERGRQKASADLAAIGRYAPWRAPFFARGWTRTVRALPSRWKLGAALHRQMIAELFPDLLDFPEEGCPGKSTSRRPPPRYWLRGPDPGLAPHYLDQKIFRGGELLRQFGRYRDTLDDLIAPEMFDHLVAEQASSCTRPHLAFALLALAVFRSQSGPPSSVPGTGREPDQIAAITPYLSSN